jgi:hypothetical protein
MRRPAIAILLVAVSVPIGKAQSKYASDVLALNPLGYWRLNGNGNDASTHGNNGVPATGVTFTGPWTTSNNVLLAKEEGSVNFRGFALGLDNGEGGAGTPIGGGRLVFALQHNPSFGPGSGNFLAMETLSPINDGNWHFLVATYDGSGQARGISLYVDGAAAATTLYSTGNSLSSMTTVNSVPVEIGARAPDNDRPFTGLLAEAAIFGTALTAAQVRQLQNDTGLSVTASIPHFAVGGSFVTGFSVVNSGSQPANFAITFRDDGGKQVSLPFNGLGSLATLSDTITANGAKYYEAGTPQGT